MKRILRSIIDFQDGTNSPSDLLVNYQRLKDQRLRWTRPDDSKVYDFIQDYLTVNLGDVPSIHTIQDYFERSGETEVLERLKDVAQTPCYTGGNFNHLLNDLLTQQNEAVFQHILKSALEIGAKGLTVGEGKKQVRLKGIRDALSFVMDQTVELLPTEHNGEIRGDVREDTEKAWIELQEAKLNKGAIGKLTGLETMDQACRGCKPGELWIHAGFPGELKCLAGDTQVFDHSVGRSRTLLEMYKAQQLPLLAGLTNEGRLKPGEPAFQVVPASHLVSNGQREVYVLRLRDGHTVAATGNHRFYTPEGWVMLKDLSPGDPVAVREGDSLACGALLWSDVELVWYRGTEEVFDLEVPGTHSFFANDILTHNTTLAINWCYNLVTRYRTNVMFCSLEMKMNQLRRSVYTLHSSNRKFRQNGLVPTDFRGLDYRKIRDGELSEQEEAYYRTMLTDFNEDPEHCRFKIWCPAQDVTIKDIRTEAEQQHRQMELGFIVIDHSLLVKSDSSSKEYLAQMNTIVREAKKMALHFNNGRGIPVLLLQQINRQGKLLAEKNNGEYNASALAQVNECLAEGTLVQTDTGWTPIEKVQVGAKVWSRAGWKTVKHSFDNGVRDTVRVQSFNGPAIQCTPDHLFQTIGTDGVAWVEAKDLSGKYVLAPYDAPVEHHAPANLHPLEIHKWEKPTGMKKAPLKVPEQVTPELAYLMGAFAGDGKAGDEYLFGWTGNRLEVAVQDRLTSHFQECFGQTIGVSKSPSRPGTFDLVKSSKPLVRWARESLFTRDGSIPACVLEGPTWAKIHYLKGLWDTDGTPGHTHGFPSLIACGAKRGLLEKAQLLMQSLGIPTSLRGGSSVLRGKRHARVVLTVRTRRGVDLFRTLIGFTEPQKMARLERHHPEKCNVYWPCTGLFTRLARRYWGRHLHRGIRNLTKWIEEGTRFRVPRSYFETILQVTPEVADPDLDLVRSLMRCQAQLVESVTPAGQAHVYDLDVGGDHEYCTGGLLTHNCEKSADYITTTYLSKDLRAQGRTVVTNIKNRDNPIFDTCELGVDFMTRRMYDLSLAERSARVGIGMDEPDDALLNATIGLG